MTDFLKIHTTCFLTQATEQEKNKNQFPAPEARWALPYTCPAFPSEQCLNVLCSLPQSTIGNYHIVLLYQPNTNRILNCLALREAKADKTRKFCC